MQWFEKGEVGCYSAFFILTHMGVGWLGRVLMCFEKCWGGQQDLWCHFGSRSWWPPPVSGFSLSYGIGCAGLGRLEGTGWEVLSQGSPRRGCPGVQLGAAVGGFSHPSCLQRGYTPASRGGQSSGSSALLPVWWVDTQLVWTVWTPITDTVV